MYFLKKTFKTITINVRKKLNRDFPNPGILDKDESTPGEFVQNTPEIDEYIANAEAAKRILDGKLDEHLPNPNNRNYAEKYEKRKKIVENYRKRKAGEGVFILTQEEYASEVGIDPRTLRNYLKEFPE